MDREDALMDNNHKELHGKHEEDYSQTKDDKSEKGS